jgi:hypothetical protein
MASERPIADGVVVCVAVGGGGVLVDAVTRLAGAGVGVADVSLRRPTLDDVFLALTGHGAAAGGEPEAETVR